ncbi:meiosis initiator protein [Lithobates pipiens]
MKQLPLDMEDLARSLPGGQRAQHSMRALLRHAISYIQFLQKRIRDTQDTLVPYSSQLGFWPLWTPRRSLGSTENAGKCHPEPRKRIQLKVCAESRPPDSELRAGQKLVPYVSSSSSENGDTGPWLVSVMVSSPPPLSPSTPQSSVPPFLGLSPSLCSSPVDDVTVGGIVPPVLFEEVQICCSSPIQESTMSSTLSLDHSYQIQNEISTENSGPQKNRSYREEKQPDTSADPELNIRQLGLVTKPRPRSKARARKVKPPTSSHPPDAQTSGKKTSSPSRLQPTRKKCVNGFIMFCRLNRKAYLRANPGKASTTATRDLAELWRNMSVKERRPYCMKALHYSLINDRLVKQRNVNLLSGEVSPPKPLSVLMAEKSLPLTPVPRFFHQDLKIPLPTL